MSKYRVPIILAIGILISSVPHLSRPLIDRPTFSAVDLVYYLYFIARYWLVDSTNPYDPSFQNVVISEMMGKNMINAMSLVWTPSAFIVLAPFAFLQRLWLPLGILSFVVVAYAIFCLTISRLLKKTSHHSCHIEVHQQILIFTAAAIFSQCFLIGLRLGQPILLCLSGLIILTSLVTTSTKYSLALWVGVFLILSIKPFYLLCPIVLLIRERKLTNFLSCSIAVVISWLIFTAKTGIQWIPSYLETLTAFTTNTSSPLYSCLAGARPFTVSFATAFAPFVGDEISFRLSSYLLIALASLLIVSASLRAFSKENSISERNIFIILSTAAPCLFLQFFSPYEELLLLVPILAVVSSAGLIGKKFTTCLILTVFMTVMIRPEVPGDYYRLVIFLAKVVLVGSLLFSEFKRVRFDLVAQH